MVRYIIEVETHIHVFAFRHRLVIGHVSAQTRTVIETLLAETLIFEPADRCREIKVPYPARMRSLCSIIERKACTRVGVVFIIVVHSDITGNLGLRIRSGTLRTYVDHTIQRGRTVQHRRSAFYDLHLRHIFQGHVIPVDLAGLWIQDRHSVHQHLTSRTHAIGPSATATDRRLFVYHLHSGERLERSGQVCRSLAAQRLRFYHLNRHRDIGHALLKAAGCYDYLVKHLIIRLHHHVVFRRNGFKNLLLGLIADIGKLDMRRQCSYLQRIHSVKIRNGPAVVIRIQNRHTDKRLSRESVGDNTR